jgi:sporulation protein YlmC with PRC-barrel domain
MNGRRGALDIGLRLLDHQITGRNEELLGNVDNIVLEERDGALTVTGVITGPPGLGPRMGGRVQIWMRAIWRRLRPEGDPAPVVIEMRHVLEIGAVVTVDDDAAELVVNGAQLERWLRYYVLSRIPGATGGEDRLAGAPIGPAEPAGKSRTVRLGRDTHLLSSLLGAQVIDPDGADLGVVLDVSSEPPPGRGPPVGDLRLTAVLFGHRRLGAQMGYAMEPNQGPWIVAAPMRAWHRTSQIVPIEDVASVDWDDRRVRLRTLERARHPSKG